MTRKKRIVIVMLAAAALSPTPFACGPFFPKAIFTTTARPDAPIQQYVGGELGIVQATYARVYLYTAYRHLSGQPFPEAERSAVLSYWEPDKTLEPPPPGKNRYGWNKEWVDYWEEARGSLTPPRSEGKEGSETVQTEKPVSADAYDRYANCLPDAFRNAVQTFQARRKAFGAESPLLQEWVSGQETVFANCGGPDLRVPAAPADDWPVTLRADRQYQIASAYFYGGKFEEARQRFAAIAADTSSPWRSVARLLVARSLIRKGTLENDTPALAQAESELQAIAGERQDRSVHAAAGRLLGFVKFRLHPEERGLELAANLAGKSPATRRQDMIDFTRWLDQRVLDDEEYEEEGKVQARTKGLGAMASLRQKSDMTDWMLTFQAGGPSAQEHALNRWKESSSVAWLLAAIVKADAQDPEAENLIRAAEQIPLMHPGYVACAFHAIRLLAGRGKTAEARERLYRLLQNEKVQLSVSARNAFHGLGAKFAKDLGEFVRFAPRVPAEIGYTGEPEAPVLDEVTNSSQGVAVNAHFDGDVARALTEQVPLVMLMQAAKSDSLPRHLQRELTLAAWTRAALLGRTEAVEQLSPRVAELAPELAEALKGVSAAKGDEQKKFAAALLILKFPGLRPFVTAGLPRETAIEKIDGLRDNWWCAFQPPEQGRWHQDYYRMWLELRGPLARAGGNAEAAASFLDADARAAGEQEWKALQGLPSAPNALGQMVLDWARENADDGRVPEALHRVVRATRHGCSDQPYGKISKQAFDLLHGRYAGSEWAKKTPYWFD